MARRIDVILHETEQARVFGPEYGSRRLDEPGLQIESWIERGFRIRGPVDNAWGRSESLDPDNVGDIADEGMGHRG
jgi:hypothetical protein